MYQIISFKYPNLKGCKGFSEVICPFFQINNIKIFAFILLNII